MNRGYTTALKDYCGAFKEPQDPFLFHYSFNNDRPFSRSGLNRGEFWSLARRAAFAIKDLGCRPGDCVAHCFGTNNPFDLVFRLAATLTGTIPVTVNWQADSIDRIFYKIELTASKLVITDSSFSREHLEAIRKRFPRIPLFRVDEVTGQREISEDSFCGHVDQEYTKIIVFTSGTTGNPRGAELPYRCYRTNQATFEQFLEITPNDRLAVLIVNPLHHANSTAVCDWAMRRPGSHIHLIEKYSTEYWKILTEVRSLGYERVIAPTVSRHFDFLEDLARQNALPVEPEELKQAMRKTDFLIGSAPVGPTIIKRIQDYAGRIPDVRFGSTETCLQVIGIPRGLSEEAKQKAFKRGWGHLVKGEAQVGYYIGRPHHPYTEARIVRNITPEEDLYMKDCEIGEPGFLITRGGNVMSGYVKDPRGTREVFHDGWYTGLQDICFVLRNEEDGELDYYWLSRVSALLIRGGANYAYDQINSELTRFVCDHYQLKEGSFDIAVVGLKVESEHEDSCCVTIEAKDRQAQNKMPEILQTFKELARRHVSKGARPDYVRFASIPRNFKGAVLAKELAGEFRQWLRL